MTGSYFWKIAARPEPTILRHNFFFNFDPSLTKLFMWVYLMNTTTWLNFGADMTKIGKKLCPKIVGPNSNFFLCVISYYINMPDYGFSISSPSSIREPKSTLKPAVYLLHSSDFVQVIIPPFFIRFFLVTYFFQVFWGSVLRFGFWCSVFEVRFWG